jgi:uncharacterized phage-associated protein
MPTYDVFDIANYFLLKAKVDGQELLSNLKVQKLVYYAQGLHLVVFNKPLFNDAIQAWRYGPVVPRLYHELKVNDKGGIPPPDGYNSDKIDKETQEFLDEIYQVFGQFSAIRLMQLTHSDKCWQDAAATPGQEITKESMKREMKKYLKNG